MASWNLIPRASLWTQIWTVFISDIRMMCNQHIIKGLIDNFNTETF